MRAPASTPADAVPTHEPGDERRLEWSYASVDVMSED